MTHPTLALIGFGRMMQALADAVARQAGAAGRASAAPDAAADGAARRLGAERLRRRVVSAAMEAMPVRAAELRDAPG